MQIQRTLRVVATILLAVVATSSHGWNRGTTTTFAEMPAGTAHPEGLTVDVNGNFYVADFDVSKPGGPGNIVIFDRTGQLVRVLQVAGSSQLLLGLAFHPQTNELLVCDLGTHSLLRVDPLTGAASVFSTLPLGAGPNALAFDAAGNVYASDSFLSTIWRTPAGGGAPTAWSNSPLLGTTGVPPFGANGMAFNKAGTTLYVANTGNDTVVAVPVLSGGAAGAASVFINSINGADGLITDENDNLWVAANQSDEIVVVDPTARVIAKLGDFGGIDEHGAAIGLLFPASPALYNGYVYVTNLALDLRVFGLAPTTNTLWSADATRFTISRIKARIAPVSDHH